MVQPASLKTLRSCQTGVAVCNSEPHIHGQCWPKHVCQLSPDGSTVRAPGCALRKPTNGGSRVIASHVLFVAATVAPARTDIDRLDAKLKRRQTVTHPSHIAVTH